MEIVVIGGNAAGLSAASAIRRIHQDWMIDVYEKDQYISYGSCGIPYYVSDEVKNLENLITLTPEKVEKKRKIPVHLMNEVINIDFGSKTLTILNKKSKSEFKRSYDRLIIATGAHATSFPELSLDHERIFYVHNLSHAERLRTILKSPEQKIQSVAIIGAGYIGLEMLEAYKAQSINDISIIGPRLVFRSQSQDYILKELKSHGVKPILGKKVVRLEALTAKKIKIHLEDDSALETDLLQISIGVSPATDIFQNKGLRMLSNGAILTDEYMKTNISDVYAAGDCIATYHQILRQHVYYPLAPAANKQGRLAGSIIAGKEVDFYPGIVGTSIFKVLDLFCARTGITLEQAVDLGYDAESVLIENNEIAHYMGTKKMSILLVFDSKSHLLLGSEITAPTALGAKKIDIIATALSAKMKIEDLQALDLAYAPPFAPVWDPILIAANIASKKLGK